MPVSSSRLRAAFLALIFVASCVPARAEYEELLDARGIDVRSARREWFYRGRVGPGGDVPEGARQRGITALKAMAPSPLQSREETLYSPLGGAVQTQRITTPWVFAGPKPSKDTGDVYGVGDTSVRVNAIAVHPTDPNTLYIGTAYAGIAKSVDGGVNWSYVSDGLPSQAISAVVIDTTAPNIVYAGSGDAYNYIPRGQHLLGVGVYRSTDSGATWGLFASSSFSGYVIHKLVIDPATSGSQTATTLYAAVAYGPSSASRGVWKSLDSGQTWARVNTGVGFNASAFDVVLATAAAAPTLFMANQVGVYKSVDAGANWTLSLGQNPNADKATLAFAKGVLYFSNSTGSYSSAQAPSYSYVSNGNPTVSGNVWKSVDLGASWTALAAANGFCGTQCFYNQYVAVDPSDPAKVFLGGVDASSSAAGGAAFTNYAKFNPPLQGLHSDHHALAFAPSNSAVVYEGNDGGVYASADSGLTWASRNSNLAGGLIVGIGLSADGNMVAGLQDNGSRKYTGTTSWNGLVVGGGDGGFNKVASGDSLKMYHTYVTAGTVSSFLVRRTLDGGASAVDITPAAAVGAESAEFYSPLWLDPADSASLLLGLQHVYRSADSGTSWTRLGALNTPAGAGNNIYCLAQAPSDSGTVWAGAGNNHVYKTSTAGGGNAAAWTDVTLSGLPTLQAPTAIAIHPTLPGTVYVTYSQYGTTASPLSHVYKTTDGGTTWAAAGAGLPDVPVNDIVIDTVSPSNLFAASDVGVYNTIDAAKTWTRSDAGMPLGMIAQSLSLQSGSRKLAVGSFGRGAYTLTLPSAPPAPAGLAAAVLGTSSITWTWAASAAQYDVQAYGVYYSSSPSVLIASVTAPAYTLTGLPPGTATGVVVTAVNGVLESVDSASVTATTVLGPGQPGPPIATVLGVSSISWSWAAASGAVSYNLYAASSPAVLMANTAATTYVETGLATNTVYGLIALGLDISMGGDFNTSALTYTLAAPPTGFALTQITTSTLLLSWGPNGNPAGTSFRLDYAQAGGGAVNTLTTTATTAALSGLFPNATYTMTVGALNGNSVLTASGLTLSSQTLSVSSVTTTVLQGAAAALSFFSPAGPVSMSIPAGAFAQTVDVTLSTPTAFAAPVSNAGALIGTGVGVQIDLEPALQPLVSVRLSLSYRTSDVVGLDPARLVLARFEPSAGVWVPLVSGSDPANRIVYAEVEHFSLFQLMQASPSESVEDAKVFPNPMRPSLGQNSVTFTRLPANARIRIYTLSGVLVRDLSADGTGMARWDANNQAGSQVASGVYFVFAQGNRKRRTFKVAIQR